MEDKVDGKNHGGTPPVPRKKKHAGIVAAFTVAAASVVAYVMLKMKHPV